MKKLAGPLIVLAVGVAIIWGLLKWVELDSANVHAQAQIEEQRSAAARELAHDWERKYGEAMPQRSDGANQRP